MDVANIHHDAKSNGDTWDYIWADDGNIYSFGCDGRGYGKIPLNVNFNKLTGTTSDGLTGEIANPMDDYGKPGQKIANGSNWKTTGADCIDGVLYAFIADNWYGNQPAFGGKAMDPFIRQTVNNMCLIKSTDKGRTWTPDAKTNATRPMSTAGKFQHRLLLQIWTERWHHHTGPAGQVLYAISNNGYWNCGSAFHLGRAREDRRFESRGLGAFPQRKLDRESGRSHARTRPAKR